MWTFRLLRQLAVLALLPSMSHALDNGLGLTPPSTLCRCVGCADQRCVAVGWRSYNAFGGRIDQEQMITMMNAMVDKSRMVDGKPTSLAELGYNHVGLDGGWNYCFPENHTFHWASDGRPVWNEGFPDPNGMVSKAHELGLSPGVSRTHRHTLPEEPFQDGT